MAAHSNVLAWRIPGTGEPGGLPSMGSHRVTHDWSNLAAAAAAASKLAQNKRHLGEGKKLDVAKRGRIYNTENMKESSVRWLELQDLKLY